VIEAELDALEPPVVVDVTEAAAALANFGLFWDAEEEPQERNRLLRIMFERVTVDEGEIRSVTPRRAFAPYFQFGAASGAKERERRGSIPRFTPHEIEIRP